MKKNTIEEHTKSKLILFFLSLFCGIMIIVSFALEFTNSPVKDVVGVVLTPIQSGINRAGGWFSGKMDYFEDNLKLVTQNEELQSQVDQLTVENTQLLQDKDELNSLRDLYELDHKYESYEKVGARVISKDDSSNWFSTFTINKGSNDGLAVDMNVMAGSGLVGIITDVGPNWATVRSIIDDYSNVSAQIRETEDTCIIAGDLSLTDEGTVRLVKLNDPDSKVKVGDTVVTSQISDIFLPGILIGYVSEIGVDSNNLTSSGLVSTVVDFKDIKEVLVIKNLKQKAEETREDKKMRTKASLLCLMLLCLILQCTLMPAISIASITPNLMISFTVSFGLMRGKKSGMLIGFFSGLLMDMMCMVLGYYLIGFRAFIYMYIGYLCGYCYQIFYDDDVKMPVLLTAAADLAYGLIVYTVQFLLRGRVDFFFYLKRIIVPEMIYTVLVTLVLYRVFLFLNKKIEKTAKRSVDSFV